MSYLEAKHLLLLHYCTAIVFYLLLKAVRLGAACGMSSALVAAPGKHRHVLAGPCRLQGHLTQAMRGSSNPSLLTRASCACRRGARCRATP